MHWRDLSPACKRYLIAIYALSIPVTIFCLTSSNAYPSQWLLLTVISIFVSTVNVRLPTISSVISMGDVFTILALTQFGPGPALIMYWFDMIAGHLTDVVRHYGFEGIRKIKAHKIFFNLACCVLSVYLMHLANRAVLALPIQYPANGVVALLAIAITWFFVNTITLSVAISYWSNQSFWPVWREGINLALLNFLGSAAAAGLISMFYKWAGFWVFLLSLPIAVVVYQLYVFYIERFERAQAHIAELSKLYLQTVEALSSAVDAKDRYTHGHIRRVQAYATELARCIGLANDKELLAIQAGALLHDIGKIAIPEYILNKPTVLTESEFEKMKIHPVVGATMLSSIEFPYPVVPIVKYHHERWDGNGYPEGLRGEEIPLSARILSLVDCYDALTTNRPYRAPMTRDQIVDFFQRESGRAYDPTIVRQFIDNLDRIVQAGKAVTVVDPNVWGADSSEGAANRGRKLERVQPTIAYSKALEAEPEIQRQLYSIFEFAQADFQCWTIKEVFSFIGAKLEHLIDFDAAVFYTADLSSGVIVAEHVVGKNTDNLAGLSLTLEQKLTGWVAANNQALCNLPPFPDFLKCEEPKPTFQLSAIAPMNRHGKVLGAISLYRKEQRKFSEEEFRRLEIIASQTAMILEKRGDNREPALLFDSLTGLPNGFQLYLTFEQIVMDAHRYEYPVALVAIGLDDIKNLRRKWGEMSGDEIVRTTARHLNAELRESDLLIRYAADEFISLNPKMDGHKAESLKSRLQNELDHFQFAVRSDVHIPLRVSVGIAVYPEDGTDLKTLLSVAEWRMRDDRELRSAVGRRVKSIGSSN